MRQTVAAQRVAPAQPPGAQPAAPDEAEPRDGLGRVVGTAGDEATVARKQGRKHELYTRESRASADRGPGLDVGEGARAAFRRSRSARNSASRVT